MIRDAVRLWAVPGLSPSAMSPAAATVTVPARHCTGKGGANEDREGERGDRMDPSKQYGEPSCTFANDPDEDCTQAQPGMA